MSSSVGSILHYNSPSSSSSAHNSRNNLLELLQQGNIVELSIKYKKHLGYILSAYCQRKIIAPNDQKLLDYMSYSLSTDVGRLLLKEFPQHYDPIVSTLSAKYFTYTLQDFEKNNTLEGISQETNFDTELETNKDFLIVTFRKGWTRYLNYTDTCLHYLLEVLSDHEIDSSPYIEYLTPVKAVSIYLDLTLSEFNLLCKLIPDTYFDGNFNSAYYAYNLGIYDLYLIYSTFSENVIKLDEMVARSLFEALSDLERWIANILQKNKVQLNIVLQNVYSLFPSKNVDDIIKNTENVLCELISDYQPIDVYYYHDIKGNIYSFTRPEFDTLLNNLENIYTREQLSIDAISELTTRVKCYTDANLPESLPLRDLIKHIPKRVPLQQLLSNKIPHDEIEESNMNILTFMYGNYSIWVHHYLGVSSTIYSYLYRCFTYWDFLHNVDKNFITSVCIDIISLVQRKFPQMTEKDCVNFIVNSPRIDVKNKYYVNSFIDFCSNWYRFYQLRQNNVEMKFVHGCLSLLGNILKHK